VIERSAEWLRGAKYTMQTSNGTREEYDEIVRLLAEAEARESLQGSKEKMALCRIYQIASRQLAEPAGMGDAVAMAKICTEVEAVHLPGEASVPTAAEVIAAAEKALGGIEWFLDAGVQESSMAPRCCSVCGKVQVEGKPEHGASCNAVEVKATLAAIAKWKEAQNAK